MLIFHRLSTRAAGWARSQAARRRPSIVRMAVGRGEPMIVAAAHADGRVRIAFGTGEEFFGPYQELPSRIGFAAREVLDVAGGFVGRLPRYAPDDPFTEATVRFRIHTADEVFAAGAGLIELRNDTSPLAPLWTAFSQLNGPLIVSLFGKRNAANLPGLRRSLGLWG